MHPHRIMETKERPGSKSEDAYALYPSTHESHRTLFGLNCVHVVRMLREAS